MGQAFEAGMRAAIAAREPYVEAASETHSEWSRRVGAHCPVCGQPVAGTCTSCAALPCRADTTDPVAPDPPCAGYRRQTALDALRRSVEARIALWRHEAEPDGLGDDDSPIVRDAVRICANELAEDLAAWLEQAAAREPQPAPGPLALQLIIAVDALRDIADEPHAGYGPVRAAAALDDIGTPGFGEPQPVPGVHEATGLIRESKERLELIMDILGEFIDPGTGRFSASASDALMAEWHQRAGLDYRRTQVAEPQPAPELADDDPFGAPVVRTGKPEVRTTADRPAPELAAARFDAEQAREALSAVMAEHRQLRELVDEIGVMAANAPEDGDSFAVCEEIAMRIAAHGIPEEPSPESLQEAGSQPEGSK